MDGWRTAGGAGAALNPGYPTHLLFSIPARTSLHLALRTKPKTFSPFLTTLHHYPHGDFSSGYRSFYFMMRPHGAFVALTCWHFAYSASTTLQNDSPKYEGVIRWDIERRHRLPKKLTGRASTFMEEVTNEKQIGGYFTTVKVGSPGQDLKLLLDTGSSDTWVPAVDAPVCILGRDGCLFGSSQLTLTFPRLLN